MPNSLSNSSIAIASSAHNAPLNTHNANRQRIALWLLACCALVFAIVVVGGVTRLTHSGLSITEWQPVVGTIPPMSDAAWEEAFSKYRATPEYKKINRGMSLQAFKRIFWWEYFHRLLGRLIGLAFLLPLLYFTISKRIERTLVPRLVGLFILGGLQGAMGWYMVQSGLVDNPSVSHYRLTAHLGLAVLIYASMLWLALGLLRQRSFSRDLTKPRRYAWALTWLIFIMILSGGLVAGMRAGHAYNTFPLMNGSFVPPEMFALQPWYANFFTNMATVQFDHRLLAWLLAFSVPAFWLLVRRYAQSARAQLALNCLLAMLVIQLALGVTTLLLVVPVPLAAAHQAGALLLLSTALWVAHELS